MEVSTNVAGRRRINRILIMNILVISSPMLLYHAVYSRWSLMVISRL